MAAKAGKFATTVRVTAAITPFITFLSGLNMVQIISQNFCLGKPPKISLKISVKLN